VSHHLPGQWDIGCHQYYRPDDGVKTHYILAHQMYVGGPEFFIQFVIYAAVSQGRYVVGKSVDPNVHYMPGIKGNLDAPVKGGAGNTEILQPAFNKADHFISPGNRLYEIRIFLNVP